MILHIVCPSVRDVEVCFSHSLEYFENNFTAEYLKVSALAYSSVTVYYTNKCKKTYQFKTRCKDDMVMSDI